MSNETIFPPFNDFEATWATLHAYINSAGVIPRAHAPAHPNWYHASFRVYPGGLIAEKVPLPRDGHIRIKMDLRTHKVKLETNYGERWAFSMNEGLTSTEFGNRLIETAASLGLEGAYARDKFESDEPRYYNPEAARALLTALVNVDRIFRDHRETLTGHVGPVQFWPHNFDLAFEWFGTRVETYEKNGQTTEYPAQLNLGFYPSGDPYFYSNPWPFEADQLLDQELPEDASWHTEGWQGAYLPYKALVGEKNAEARLREFARRVFEVASPTLLARSLEPVPGT
jgi:hypothetical protein